MTKQTAANNALLAWTKRQYNGKIFAKTSELLNKEGADQAIAYLLEFVSPEVCEDRKTYLIFLSEWTNAKGTPGLPRRSLAHLSSPGLRKSLRPGTVHRSGTKV